MGIHCVYIPIGSNKTTDVDLGVAVPTTFMPSFLARSGPTDCPRGFGTCLADIIQFGELSASTDAMNLCVAPDFACGGPIHVPRAFEPSLNPPNASLIQENNWTFVNQGSDGTKPGYYLAIYRPTSPSGGISNDWGLIEAYDTWLNSNSLSFEAFRRSVKTRNLFLQLRFGIVAFLGVSNQPNSYTTQSGQQIQFTISPHSQIVSTTADPPRGIAFANAFARGTVVNSERMLAAPRFGTGLITVSNPALNIGITLDMHFQVTPEDVHYGMHHPRRISESGEVDSASHDDANRVFSEIWVDSKYTGPGAAGDFGDPLRTLGQAITKVAIGGTVRVINAEAHTPTLYNKRVTIRVMSDAVTLVP